MEQAAKRDQAGWFGLRLSHAVADVNEEACHMTKQRMLSLSSLHITATLTVSPKETGWTESAYHPAVSPVANLH